MSHTTHRGRRSKDEQNGRCWSIQHLGLWLLQLKLGLAPPNRSCTNDTHDRVERRIKNRDRRIGQDPHDSQRKNKLITGRRILIDTYDKDNEMGREVYREVRDDKNLARGFVIEL